MIAAQYVMWILVVRLWRNWGLYVQFSPELYVSTISYYSNLMAIYQPFSTLNYIYIFYGTLTSKLWLQHILHLLEDVSILMVIGFPLNM